MCFSIRKEKGKIEKHLYQTKINRRKIIILSAKTRKLLVTCFIASLILAPTVSADSATVTNLYQARTMLSLEPSYRSGCWKYLYTIEPYSYYRHTGTGKLTRLQTTSTVNHTVNTIVGGWAAHSSSWPIPTYNPAFAGLMGGCP